MKGNCKCENVKKYDGKWRCMECFREFTYQEDYDEAWGLYMASENTIHAISQLPQKWREQDYWDNPIEECSMDIEYVLDEPICNGHGTG